MTFVPEGSPITPEHQLAALPDVLAITGTGADDATLLQPDPVSYQATIDQLVELGQLDADPGVDTTYNGSFWDTPNSILTAGGRRGAGFGRESSSFRSCCSTWRGTRFPESSAPPAMRDSPRGA